METTESQQSQEISISPEVLRNWLLMRLTDANFTLPLIWEEKFNEYVKSKEILLLQESRKTYNPGVPGNTSFIADMIPKELKQLRDLHFFLKKDSLRKYSLPDAINPSGVILPGLVVEPLGGNRYAYNWCNLKGICDAEVYKHFDGTQEHPDPKKKSIYLGLEWSITVCGKKIKLDKEPSKRFAFRLPNIDKVYEWNLKKRDALTTQQLWDLIEKAFKVFMDLQEEHQYTVIPLIVFQSWLQEALPSVFYTVIGGAWGTGKTTLGESIINLCKHGAFIDPSVALIARGIHSERLSVFIDELDSIADGEDNELYSLIRKGYRKGALFARINKEKMEPEYFNVYGTKIFTIHTGIEDALQTRSIPISLVESDDNRLPEINAMKEFYIKPIFDELFLWYLDNGVYFVDDVADVDASILYDQTKNVESVREAIYNKYVNINNNYNNLNNLKGRNRELAANMVKICNLLKLSIPDDKLSKLFDSKKLLEAERTETGPVSLLKDLLAEVYQENKTNPAYITEEGFFKISHKNIFERFHARLRQSEKFSQLTPKQFQGYMREFGFEAPVSKRPMRIMEPGTLNEKVLLCYIYIPKVIKRLDIAYESLFSRKYGERNVEEEKI